MAHGIADVMLSTTGDGHRGHIFVAPAMNEKMWEHPAVQDNMRILVDRGADVVGPGKGFLACGDVGYGRMEEPQVIVERVLDLLYEKKDFAGKRVVGYRRPYPEPIDPVRYISNRSSGKMGSRHRPGGPPAGAQVVLIHGPMAVEPPLWVESILVETTAQMRDAVLREFDGCDVLIKAAAPWGFPGQGGF